jgi:hypothetical protein
VTGGPTHAYSGVAWVPRRAVLVVALALDAGSATSRFVLTQIGSWFPFDCKHPKFRIRDFRSLPASPRGTHRRRCSQLPGCWGTRSPLALVEPNYGGSYLDTEEWNG